MKKSLYTPVLALVALAMPLVQAAEDVQMQVKKVSVFKNGYSQVSLEGPVSGNGAQLRLLDVPVPMLGSFWWKAPQGVSVREVRSVSAEVQVPRSRYSTLDFLLANRGMKAEVMLRGGVMLSGQICAPPEQSSTSSFRPAPVPAAGPGVLLSVGGEQPGSPSVLLRTHNGVVPLMESNILYASVLTDTPRYPTETKEVPALLLDLTAPAPGQALQISALCQGLSWLPSYRLDLDGEEKGFFRCKAMVMNELADLQNVDLELVMGYPALGKKLIPSPVSHYPLSRFLSLLRVGDTRRMAASLTTQNMVMSNALPPEETYAETLPADTGALTQAEDLFFYSVPDFCCGAGQTITRELFSGEVPCSHVYTWNVPTQEEIRRWQRQEQEGIRAYPSAGAPNEVWHCVRVKNTLKSPWTTGVLDCYAAGRLVGRTELTFTDEGASSLVRLNKTMQAPVRFSENIVGRIGSERTIEGKLSLTNTTGKEMKLLITKTVIGTPLSASDDAVRTSTPDVYANPLGTFRWEISVPSGETRTVTYRYAHLD